MDTVLCRINRITKSFPGVTALQDVSFDIYAGTVHAVIGENGAGKSTLMNILSGVYRPDGGGVEFEGKPAAFRDPRAARNAGIAMIHQELSLAPHMSAAENVFEGRMPKNRAGFISYKKMEAGCRYWLERLGVTHINPKIPAENLSVSEMQLLEIAKSLSLEAKMLIMDEPTSSLSAAETNFLLELVERLRGQGVATLYISHKLEEVRRIAGTVTVLRDGRHIATKPKQELDEKTMVSLMVGRNFEAAVSRNYMTARENKTPLLEVRGLSDAGGKVHHVSFSLHKGEVLGLTGLVGAGRSELLETIFGVRKIKAGEILLEGKPARIRNPRDAIDLGMGLIPEGRKIQGLFLKMSVKDNMLMVVLKKLRNIFGFVTNGKTGQLASEYTKRLAIKTPSVLQIVNNLSGGNQQKTIIARWLMNKPRILLMDEPAHGIDIGAKAEIYRIIDELSREGVSVILLSSELPEVLSLCDRIMVMHRGELRAILEHSEADQMKILSYIFEGKRRCNDGIDKL